MVIFDSYVNVYQRVSGLPGNLLISTMVSTTAPSPGPRRRRRDEGARFHVEEPHRLGEEPHVQRQAREAWRKRKRMVSLE
jgi:hypothetical protein